MTVHAHDPAVHADGARPGPAGGATATTAARPRWLVPGLAIGVIVATLVVAGVLSLSTVLYAGLIGGMFVMHLGGHGGHGGHRGHGGHGGHADHARGTTSDGLRAPSSGTQVWPSGSDDEIGHGTVTNESRDERDHHDKHISHGCH